MRGLLVFRNPVFGRFWLGRVASYLGSTVTVTALTLYAVYEAGLGSISMALILACVTLPRLLGPVAGAVVDRADARRLMVLCDVGQAALIGAVALTLPPLPVLLALVLAASVLAALFFPAGRGAVPALVAPEDLAGANALLGSAFNLSIAVGPALAGVLVAGIGAGGALAFDAATFLVSAGLLLSLPAMPPAARPAHTARFVGEVREGLAYVAREPAVRAVALASFLGVAFVAADGVALAFLARDALRTGEVGFGALGAAHGIGMILGPLLLLAPGRPFVRVGMAALVPLGLALEGAATLLVGLAPGLLAAVLLRAVGGIGNGIENVAADTLIGETVARPMLGRVFGAVYAPIFLAEALGVAWAGLLLQVASPRFVFVVAGLGALATTLLVWRTLPRSR